MQGRDGRVQIKRSQELYSLLAKHLSTQFSTNQRVPNKRGLQAPATDSSIKSRQDRRLAMLNAGVLLPQRDSKTVNSISLSEDEERMHRMHFFKVLNMMTFEPYIKK